MQEPTKNKAGRKFLPYSVRPFNVRLNVALIDRMNADKVNKTELISRLLSDYFADIDKKSNLLSK